MNVQQYPLKKGQYFPDLTAKKFVVWHGTAGRTMHTLSATIVTTCTVGRLRSTVR